MRVAAALALLLLVACGSSPPAPESGPKPPNIVLIVADDLGWADVSFHGGDIATPNIDRIAREGVELDRFYVAPVCTPTRAGLMTGRYPIRFGLMRAVIPPWRDYGIATSERLMPEFLATAGYQHRAIFGKWHLGHSRPEFHPLARGFTEFVGHYNGAIDFFDHSREGALDWSHGHEPTEEEGYSTDLITDHAVEFIEAHAPKEAPFFAYVPYNAVHSPFQAKDEYVPLYADLAPSSLAQRESQTENRRILGAMNHSLDEGIGRILDALDAAGAADDTLVWFFSDNGGVNGIGENAPLRGAKATVFEGGIRVAAAARWPGGGVSGRRKVTAPLANIDVLPTLLAITGAAPDGGQTRDGVNALPVLAGEVEQLDREIYSFIGQESAKEEFVCVIDGEWKLVVAGAPLAGPLKDEGEREVMLFHLATDPHETTDVAAEHSEERDRLLEKASSFRELQPPNPVDIYSKGRDGFQPPDEWTN